MADRVADYSRAHSLNAVTAPPPATAADPALASIENRLDALVRRLDGFVPAHRRPSSRFQIHSRSSTPPRSPELRLDALIQACPLGDSYGSRSTGGSPVAPQNAALGKEEEVGIRPRVGFTGSEKFAPVQKTLKLMQRACATYLQGNTILHPQSMKPYVKRQT
ncbi:hypothetical protein HPB52_017302 [Rhipicephalus sanguineus]|uniref:Uncharacterized protein n=1 Tax=Rhipicephalus sanguineus TaxID=34632 RepID=A0A9D4Q8L4_RHISA|nr:hypothetical protein HPB52_017302 [Rhipicephalus sanguineus]